MGDSTPNSIRQIDQTSVHRITSGQVIVDLQTAVKELVENALDAGATAVEVKFKNMGLDSIEVSDNGSGIPKHDYNSLALKHHTSKLSSFADLTSVLSFGFRGEALSSLCGLSSAVEIITSTADETPTGTVIQFERSGKVKDELGKVARPRGTTVNVSGLFVPVPVRRKELEKHAKREFAKALSLLHAYALNAGSKAQGVRLTVVGLSKEGKRTSHLKTDGNSGLKASISALWGPKELVNLVLVDFQIEVEADKSAVGRDEDQSGSNALRVVGMMSSPAPGKGRTSGDRQFLYVNGRPCNLPKVQKVINDVYRSFNTFQSPFNVLDLQLPPDSCDINVSPDKRTIFLHNETNLLQGLRAGLEAMCAPSKSEFPISAASRMLSDDGTHPSSPPSAPSRPLVQSKLPAPQPRPRAPPKTPSPSPPPPTRTWTEQPATAASSSSTPSPIATPASRRASSSGLCFDRIPPLNGAQTPGSDSIVPDSQEPRSSRQSIGSSAQARTPDVRVRTQQEQRVAGPSRRRQLSSDVDELEPKDGGRALEREEVDSEEVAPIPIDPPPSRSSHPARPMPPPRGISSTINDQTISFDLDSVVSRLAKALQLQPDPYARRVKAESAINPDLASIANVNSNDTATLELQRTIDKKDFALMDVVGQYNLGFIIARKRSEAGDDLFIIDQHASDEKYNFETLQQTTRIQSQKLLHPRPLELSAADAVLVVENIEVLRQNGFDISIGQDESSDEARLALSAQPISKDKVFDFKDLEELLHLMHDRPTGEMVRCSKARSMFASRACRKSIMIGKSLTLGQMTKVVRSMGLIDQPWNCPHGRPTMRHLLSLNRWEEKAAKGARRELDWDSLE